MPSASTGHTLLPGLLTINTAGALLMRLHGAAMYIDLLLTYIDVTDPPNQYPHNRVEPRWKTVPATGPGRLETYEIRER